MCISSKSEDFAGFKQMNVFLFIEQTSACIAEQRSRVEPSTLDA